MSEVSELRFCPMAYNTPLHADSIMCVREKCAWWDGERKACAVLALSVRLRFLEQVVGRLR